MQIGADHLWKRRVVPHSARGAVSTVTVEVVRVVDQRGIDRARALRHEVFVDEFDVTVAEEYDDLDHLAGTVHALATVDGEDVGTARLVDDPDRPGVVHITRVAVRSAARRSGAGRSLMRMLESIAVAEFAHGEPPRVRVELSVMEHAAPFYRSLGYTIGEARHVEVRIWHRMAHKELGTSRSGP